MADYDLVVGIVRLLHHRIIVSTSITLVNYYLFCVFSSTFYNESISLSSSKSYMRGEIGYVTEVNLVRNNRNKSLLVCLSEYL